VTPCSNTIEHFRWTSLGGPHSGPVHSHSIILDTHLLQYILFPSDIYIHSDDLKLTVIDIHSFHSDADSLTHCWGSNSLYYITIHAILLYLLHSFLRTSWEATLIVSITVILCDDGNCDWVSFSEWLFIIRWWWLFWYHSGCLLFPMEADIVRYLHSKPFLDRLPTLLIFIILN